MNTETFKNAIRTGVFLIDFSADWCGPCKAFKPTIEKIETHYQGRASIMEINIDQHQSLATQYMVQSIPTLILFKDGNEIKRFVGLQPEKTIAGALEEALS